MVPRFPPPPISLSLSLSLSYSLILASIHRFPNEKESDGASLSLLVSVCVCVRGMMACEKIDDDRIYVNETKRKRAITDSKNNVHIHTDITPLSFSLSFSMCECRSPPPAFPLFQVSVWWRARGGRAAAAAPMQARCIHFICRKAIDIASIRSVATTSDSMPLRRSFEASPWANWGPRARTRHHLSGPTPLCRR